MPLSEDQRRSVHDAVLVLAAGNGCHGWDARTVASKAEVPPELVELHFASNEQLLADAVLVRAGDVLDRLTASAPGGGRTPRSRVLKVVRALTDALLEDPVLGRDALWTLTRGVDSALPQLKEIGGRLHMALARGVAGGEPGDPEWAVAGVIEGVWFAAAVAWSVGVGSAEQIDESVVRALRLMKVNG
ncbi:MAG: hypothetical protein ACYDHU_06575 [Acidimicrobiales bacterium]